MSIERELLKKVISGDNKGDFFISYDLYKEIYEFLIHPEQTEQEPVAWHYIYDDGITVRERVTEYMPLGKYYTVTPLYTAPPKRECITDKEIYNHCCAMDSSYTCNFIDGVEWAEEQHGIGGGG
jgi:hypothetical protein